MNRSIDRVISELNGIEALLTAKGWERAAIVWAFTNDGKPGPKGDRGEITAISCTEFAALGIAGLKSDQALACWSAGRVRHG